MSSLARRDRSAVPLSEVRERLKRLNQPGIQALSELSGVPFITLQKIRYGVTKDPGYSTVCAFLPHIDPLLAVKAHQSRSYRAELEAVSKAAAGAAPREQGEP